MISIQQVSFKYPSGKQALKNVNIEINTGEMITILGQNGSGKTTLVKHFNGLLKPTEGNVIIDGKNTKDETIASLSKKVAYVFQNPNHQIFSDTVFNEIAFSLRRRKLDEEVVLEKTNSIIKELGLEHIKDTHPMFINHAEKQIVAIASYLVLDMEIFIFDEPTSSLDYNDSRLISKIILKLKNEGKTIIVISHDMNFAVENPTRVLVMSRGELLFDGHSREMFNRDDVFYKTGLEYPQIKELCKKYEGIIPDEIFQIDELKQFLIEKGMK